MKVVCVFKKWSALNNATHKTREEGPHSKVTRLKGFFNREVTARDNPEEFADEEKVGDESCLKKKGHYD